MQEQSATLFGGMAYWPYVGQYYFVRGNNVWHATAYNSRLQPVESYDVKNNQNGSANMLFVSCPNWGYNPSSYGNYGTYSICPIVNQTNDNGNLQGYKDYPGFAGTGGVTAMTQTLGYDNLNRLHTASDSGVSRRFDYDRFGNMTPSAGTGTNYIPLAGNSPTAFNAATNQISGPTRTTYDADGNQTMVNGNAVGYDAENRTTSVAGTAWAYSFDGLGQRVQKTPYSGNSTVYIYDALGQLASEYTNGTTWARDYVRSGAGQLVATENASGPCATCYFGFDHLGSVRLVMDQSGNVVGRHDYLPYGEEVPAGTAGRSGTFGTTSDTAAKFTGQLRDAESGMDYFNARNLTPVLGRFMSLDPGSAGASLGDPQTWNGYAYVRGNLLNSVDPSGLTSGSPCENNMACESQIPGCLQNLTLCAQTYFTSNLIQSFDPFRLIGMPITSSGFITPVPIFTDLSPASNHNGVATSATISFGQGYFGTIQVGDAFSLFGSAAAQQAGVDSAPAKTGTQQQNDFPLNNYAQALFTHPTLQTTARVMTNPCTYAAWTGAAAAAGAGGVAAAHGGEIVAAVSDNSATLIYKALTWWFNFTGRPPSGAMKAATLTAPVVAAAVARACNSF